ncbi:MAG: MgtC/SapB family protein [Gemmatimonadota bacterium]|nr:MgtC/SapB family protein [Gemmatimonadota bacterium]
MEFFDFDVSRLFQVLVRIAVAFGLAVPVGWERERAATSAGIRTFPLVAAASCGYALLGAEILGANAEAQARVIQGLLTGIGFIGGGAILKHVERHVVHGTATAASLWLTGALGGAVGYGSYELAVVLSIVAFLTMRLLTPVERDQGPQASAGEG